MPQISEIDFLNNIKNLGISTVYVTAYSDYSITAIKQKCIAILRKHSFRM